MGIVAALAVTAAGCGTTAPPRDGATAPRWTAIAEPPFAPRLGAVTAWTGTEALFLGGVTSAPCPPNASCGAPRQAKDGAAYDPLTGSWRRTAPAPEAIAPYSPRLVVGDEVYLWGRKALLSYDTSRNTWAIHPGCRRTVVGADLAAVRGWVVAVRSERRPRSAPDEFFDPASAPVTRTAWRQLPDDLLGATFDRDATATPFGLVVTGHALVPSPGSDGPSVERAEILDPHTMRWRLLPDSDQLGGAGWAWSGSRMVDPSLGGEDGGPVNGYGRLIPHGGTLEPSTGRWGRLPDAPAPFSGGWNVYARDRALSAVDGWIYDDDSRTWILLRPPSGAPPRPGDAVWAGRRLIVVGGTDPAKGYTTAALSNAAWMLTLPR